MIEATVLIFQYLFPGFGILLGNFMYFAPYRDLKKAVERGELGQLNPTPWAFMLGNCCGWLTYALLLKDLFIFSGTAPGFVLSMWLNLGAAKLQYEAHRAKAVRKSLSDFLENSIHSGLSFENYSVHSGISLPSGIRDSQDGGASVYSEALDPDWGERAKEIGKIVLDVTTQEIKAPAPHETVAIVIFTFWMLLLSVIVYFDLRPATRQTVVGIVVNVNLIFFYGAPLSTIVKVLKTRQSDSIHRLTMFLNTMNGAFWAVYGFALMDPYIILPNGIGALLGTVQMILCAIFPRQSNPKNDKDGELLEDDSDIELADMDDKNDEELGFKTEETMGTSSVTKGRNGGIPKSIGSKTHLVDAKFDDPYELPIALDDSDIEHTERSEDDNDADEDAMYDSIYASSEEFTLERTNTMTTSRGDTDESTPFTMTTMTAYATPPETPPTPPSRTLQMRRTEIFQSEMRTYDESDEGMVLIEESMIRSSTRRRDPSTDSDSFKFDLDDSDLETDDEDEEDDDDTICA